MIIDSKGDYGSVNRANDNVAGLASDEQLAVTELVANKALRLRKDVLAGLFAGHWPYEGLSLCRQRQAGKAYNQYLFHGLNL